MSPSLKLLRELIALPSVNPAFLPKGDPRSGEKNVSDFLLSLAASAGLEVEQQFVFPDRPNLIARLVPPGKIKQRILFAPHLDTVPAIREQFVPMEKKGKLHGRGACDTKGSVAAMLSAVLHLAKNESRSKNTEVIFAGLIDEEHGQAGSRALIAKKIKADLAIVGEPTELKLVTAHKGDLWLTFETHGKSAHGARPELGKNAVHEMARIIDLLETIYAQILKKRHHPLLGSPTINVGTVCGGSQANIVPDSCAITADRRTLPGETEDSVRKEIKALLKKYKLTATLLNSKVASCLPLETNPKLPLIQEMLKSFGQKNPFGVDYFCDASVLSNGGIPSVVFGPGNIEQAHTADEWISIRSLEDATCMLVRYLQSLP